MPRPHGFPSLLEYYEAQIENEEPPEFSDSEAKGDKFGFDEFALDGEACRALREEAAQFYHRYIALLVLEDYDRVVRDTTRNLRVLDLCSKHAQNEDDRALLEQFRPYITMMRARGLASQAMKDNEPKAAIHALDEGLDALRMYFSDAGKPQMFATSSEAEMLRGMRDSLVPKLPISQKTEIRQRLAKVIEQENYELAAILRDELKQLKDTPSIS